MQIIRCLRLLGGTLLVIWGSLATTALAGTIGFPAARQEPLDLRFELVGDSFQEELDEADNAEATTGRALVTVALGLTSWLEAYGRAGLAEFNVNEALFSGGFGLAFGGGLRARLWRFPYGQVGLSGQYLRFSSEDDDSAGIRIEGDWEEFDVALGIGTQRFGAFQFYGGGAYHRADITLDPETGPQRTLETKIPARLFLGVHIYPLADFPGGEFVVAIEARFIGETPQFTLGLQYQF